MKTLSLTAVLLVGAVSAHAAVLDWSASMLPGNEVTPPVGADGASGLGMGTVDTITGEVTWDISWSGLSGEALRMHFHNAPPGVNGPVIVSIFDRVADPTDTSDNVSPVTGSAVLGQDQLQELLAGNHYLNLHTEFNPGGELRGQVVPAAAPVPLPAGLPLLLGGIAALGFAARRRRA